MIPLDDADWAAISAVLERFGELVERRPQGRGGPPAPGCRRPGRRHPCARRRGPPHGERPAPRAHRSTTSSWRRPAARLTVRARRPRSEQDGRARAAQRPRRPAPSPAADVNPSLGGQLRSLSRRSITRTRAPADRLPAEPSLPAVHAGCHVGRRPRHRHQGLPDGLLHQLHHRGDDGPGGGGRDDGCRQRHGRRHRVGFPQPPRAHADAGGGPGDRATRRRVADGGRSVGADPGDRAGRRSERRGRRRRGAGRSSGSSCS